MKSLVETLVRKLAQQSRVPFAVRFADGREMRYSSGDPAFTLSFRRPRAYWRTALFGHVGLLESYFDGDLDIDGSLQKALEAGMEAGVDSPNLLLRGLNRLHEFLHSNSSWMRAKHNAEFHYALGPEFYRFWLDDPLMLYTCAYWKDGTRTLEEAQRNKCDHVA
ncbi:MAG TPA: class I SAM-dependent methyltransferase, partial [Burkholderiales bacterium]|nr:class I SAM-dependent methyltransferase [Burkholderiales bacterium]